MMTLRERLHRAGSRLETPSCLVYNILITRKGLNQISTTRLGGTVSSTVLLLLETILYTYTYVDAIFHARVLHDVRAATCNSSS
jgi:hypothetical protein